MLELRKENGVCISLVLFEVQQIEDLRRTRASLMPFPSLKHAFEWLQVTSRFTCDLHALASDPTFKKK